MKLLFSALAACCALAIIACGGGSTGAADGGRGRIVCTDEYVTMAIVVLEADGGVAANADVVAKNTATGKAINGKTNEFGATSSVGEDIGQGTVEITASKEGRVSGKAQTTWVCGECHCNAEPDRVTLTLSP